jgi:hypothetical protein
VSMARPLALALALLVVVLGLAACDWHGHDDGQCDLVVVNDSSCDLKVMVDGWEAGTVRADSVRTIDDIGAGRHVVESVNRSGVVVERRTIELSHGEDYYWRITSC